MIAASASADLMKRKMAAEEEPDTGAGSWSRRLRSAVATPRDRYRPELLAATRPRLCVPLQAHQLGPHVRRMLIAQFTIFFQRAIDDVFELGRQIGIQPHAEKPEHGSGSRRKSLPYYLRGNGNMPVAIS